MREHEVQRLLWLSTARFVVCPSGRRSGKTEIAKRRLVMAALTFTSHTDGLFVACAPTRAQAKRIFWKDLKKLVPKRFRAGAPSETELSITLKTGTIIAVVGMDKPERIEGVPIDGAILDEYGNMKESVWTQHLRPALDTIDRPGWCWFIGVPEGRNHYYHLWLRAKADKTGEWEAHHWPSSDIIPEAAEAAKSDLDTLTWRQEYGGEFLSFEGRAYYAFDRALHVGGRVYYDEHEPLVFCFDFNRAPGVALVCQEGRPPKWPELKGAEPRKWAKTVTRVIDEVYIPRNSNTQKVCEELARKWGHHAGEVIIHGDASGGAGGSAQLDGSDWEIVLSTLKPTFGHRIRSRWPRANPRIRARINAVNTRLEAASGELRVAVDSTRCQHFIEDMEGCSVDTTGELEKPAGTMLTHISDGFGYYIEKVHPCLAGPRWKTHSM